MKEEKESKLAKDEKEQSAKERANERGRAREKEKKMGILKTQNFKNSNNDDNK